MVRVPVWDRYEMSHQIADFYDDEVTEDQRMAKLTREPMKLKKERELKWRSECPGSATPTSKLNHRSEEEVKKKNSKWVYIDISVRVRIRWPTKVNSFYIV